MSGRLENMVKNKTAIGIEIILLPDNGFEINAIVLEKEKSLLRVVKKINAVSSISELATIIDLKMPLILVINGKGIIHRKVNINDTDTTTTLLNKVLPNATKADFYIQQQSLDLLQAFISVVRASAIDEVIEKLKEKKIINIVSCLLGPFSINKLLPFIDNTFIHNEQLHFGNYNLQIREQQITEIKFLETPSKVVFYIAEEEVEPNLLIAFGAALSYFTNVDNGILNAPKIEQAKEEFKQKQLFNKILVAMLGVSFCILMVNYFVFTSYWTDATKLSSQLVQNQAVLSQYDTLKKEFEQKKEFLEQNGLLENAKTSYYADKLAETLPNSIKWTDLIIHPLKKKEANDETKNLFFENKLIRISGKCQRSLDLNEWMKIVKRYLWVADLKLIDYKQDNALDAGLFLIQLTLK